MPEISISLALPFLPCSKNKGLDEMIPGPHVCRGIQLQFGSLLIPKVIHNACAQVLVMKGENRI